MEASRSEPSSGPSSSLSSSAGLDSFGGGAGGFGGGGNFVSETDIVSSNPSSPAGSLQMNQVMNAAFEPLPEVELVQPAQSFQTFGSGRDVFVSENVGQCCGTYPKR